MITLEPIMGLFTNIIPIRFSHLFFDRFFKYGWKFFFSLFLVFLDEIEDDLRMEENSSYEIMQIMKSYTGHVPIKRSGGEVVIKNEEFSCVKMKEDCFEYNIKNLDWEEIMENAFQI